MLCISCKKTLQAEEKFCKFCGQVVFAPAEPDKVTVEADLDPVATSIEPAAEAEPEPEPEAEAEPVVKEQPSANTKSKKLKTVWILATFFGWLGADRFYLGHIPTGIGKLLGFGWFGVWWLLDLIRILRNKQKDRHGNLLRDTENFLVKAQASSAVIIPIVMLLCGLAFIGSIQPEQTT